MKLDYPTFSGPWLSHIEFLITSDGWCENTKEPESQSGAVGEKWEFAEDEITIWENLRPGCGVYASLGKG